jgi:hypothetical protein
LFWSPFWPPPHGRAAIPRDWRDRLADGEAIASEAEALAALV